MSATVRRWVVRAAIVALCASACGRSEQPSTGSTATAPSSTSSTTAPSPTVPALTVPAVDWSALYDHACSGALGVTVPGAPPTGLTSISGLASSLRHPGVIWAVEDSFEPPDLVGMQVDGSERARVRVTGLLANIDWEDVAVARHDTGTSWVHVADIGDNLAIRRSVRVHSFPEPDLDAQLVDPVTTRVVYPDGRPNAEAMVVVDGTIWILDKNPDGPATVYRAELPSFTEEPTEGRAVELEAVGSLDLPGEQVTAADLSPDGTLLAIRTNVALRLYPVPPSGDLLDALAAAPCETPPLDEVQGESVAFVAEPLGLLTVSEDESGGHVDLHLTTRP